MDGLTAYRSTDLDLESPEDLTSLAAAFASRGIEPLPVQHSTTGVWYTTLNMFEDFSEPDANITALLDVIESLEPELKAVWSRCSKKEFNIGYDCGVETWDFQQGLRNETLRRIAAAGATLAWTLYAYRPDLDG